MATTALIPIDTILDTLCEAHLLCEVCQMAPWTQRGVRHAVLLCANCAPEEPGNEEERMGEHTSFFTVELARLDRKIAQLGKEATHHEERAAKFYKQIAYLSQEVYTLARAREEEREHQQHLDQADTYYSRRLGF